MRKLLFVFLIVVKKWYYYNNLGNSEPSENTSKHHRNRQFMKEKDKSENKITQKPQMFSQKYVHKCSAI